jgi:hypothetical protein
VVVVRLSSHPDKLFESSKEGRRYKAARILKNCMGTPMAFESQVETLELGFSPLWPNHA